MSFELNENHQPIRRYIYENGKDDVQGYVEYSEVDDPQYFSFERKGWYSYIKDQVGTINKVYKHETKQMVDIRTSDTFGNLINQTGSSTGNLGFQSKYFDQESGLNYYFHRYYSSSIGRFINEDPIGLFGGLNLFLITINNPVNYIDKFGLYDPHNNIPKKMKEFDKLLNSPYQVVWLNGEPWYLIPIDILDIYLLERPRECDEGMIGWDPYQGLLDMAKMGYDIFSLIPPTSIVEAIFKVFRYALENMYK